MLPPGSEIEVQLQDISRADAMATVMASVMLDAEGGPPYDFAIDYDPARVDPRMRYALRATISRGERLLFTTTDYIDPFAGGDVEVLVRRVAEVGQGRQPPPTRYAKPRAAFFKVAAAVDFREIGPDRQRPGRAGIEFVAVGRQDQPETGLGIKRKKYQTHGTAIDRHVLL